MKSSHSFKWVVAADRLGWLVKDAVTGAQLREYALPNTDTEQYANLALYGLKQAVADGGAMGANATNAKRLNGMDDRHSAIVVGEWDFRDGSSAVKLPDAMLFRACVAADVFADTTANRAIWRDAPASERAAAYDLPGVADWIRANTAGAERAGALIATLQATKR